MKDQNIALLFCSKLKEAYASMSASEKKIADYILKHLDEVSESTSASLGEKTGTSSATIIRFSKTCGFSGFSDLKNSLHKELHNQERNRIPVDEVSGDAGISIIKQKVLGYHNAVINSMLSSWNESAYGMAVDAIFSAGQILIIGEGGGRSSASCLYDVLMQLELPCIFYTDFVYGAMQIGRMQPNDVVVVISYTGRASNTIQCLKLAKSRKLITIGLIGTHESPSLPYVDIVLSTSISRDNYASSALGVRISELAVIEILYAMYTAQHGGTMEDEWYKNPYVEYCRVPGELE
ncbi:MAG: MurR/RpiR family transcriptional regulator [Lachnospiraceae bacterium]|nr:MurR/RpiR family transcriptional regulator [Lachnospiraceae bacterium]